MYKKIVFICGMPRSGTSWLGQILDSSPEVAFRMEPLFSYKFKNIISEKSSRIEIKQFLKEVYLSNDDFIHQKENRVKGTYYSFRKFSEPEILVVKTTRHHHLLERYLELVDSIEMISIIRHPCAVISSWINTEREFLKKGCVVEKDWRNGACRKGCEGEFWGFDDWLAVTSQHIELSQKYGNFNIIKYADLIRETENVVCKLFAKLSIKYTEQTTDFLRDCHVKHQDDPYSVFKSKDVENKWKCSLDSQIAQSIIKETIDAGLGEFVE